MLRSPQALHQYQRRAVEHVLAHKRSMLWLDMGLGKTPVTLTAIAHLLDCFEVRGCLVIAPLRVVQLVWKQECAKWEHLQGLDVSIVHGSIQTRTRAIRRQADIYLVNYEGLPWLVNELNNTYLAAGRPLPFDMVVFDEITKGKSARLRGEGSKRLAEFMDLILPYIDRRVGLTGTPLPNGYLDLFGQYLLLDDGQRLGQGITAYKDRWFDSNPYTRRWDATKQGKEDIHTLISDITLEMNKHDYLDLPPVIGGLSNPLEVIVDMPPAARKQYEKLENEMFLELDSGAEIEINDKASLINKCLQFANGAMYTGEAGENIWEVLHDAKLDALEELIEEAGTPILLSYNFRHDAARIKDRLGERVVHLHGGIKRDEAQAIDRAFNNGEIPALMGHPASIGHGLNFQYGCHTEVFFGLPWSLELYNQFYARVMERQGQTRPGIVHFLMTRNTVDYVPLVALQNKLADETGLREAVNMYRRMKHDSKQKAA